ncbi:MAG TPA: twin-arginine translocase subunit TatC [Solirubrobacteraceae bacterium]|nr:twin-arginine translocase subunit TatC [Solirubrobacteraceae bacterium]
MARLRPIGHEDRLSIVDHLDELRTRLVVCAFVFAVAFGICFWQNHSLIHVLNRALPKSSSVASQDDVANLATVYARERSALLRIEAGALGLSQPSSKLSASDRALFSEMATGTDQFLHALPKHDQDQVKPITIGIGEPFTTTLAVSAYFALLFSLPILIYQGYAFVIPALNPNEKRVALPIMSTAPILFAIGVVFTYFVVLPGAVHFLQGFNSSQFDVLVQAKAYYTFEILTMLGIGFVFQLPLGLLGLDAIGAISAKTLTRHWRYCVVLIAVIAAALPGSDPVTTGLEMLPLILLYLASIVLLMVADRRAAARASTELATSDSH